MIQFYSKLWILLFFLFGDFIVTNGYSQTLKFTEVSQSIGIDYKHDYQIEIEPVTYRVTAGLAVGDYNNDGFPDIYVETGDLGSNFLFKNNGDGTFIEYGQEVGLDLPNFLGSSAFFVDIDNDGFEDLMLGSLDSQQVRVFKNHFGLYFEDITETGVLNCDAPTYSFGAGDYDKDGFLDLFLTHWKEENAPNHIWKNRQDGTFSNTDVAVDFYNPFDGLDFTFTGNFTDFNNDGWQDLLITSDFGTSQIWVNQNGVSFEYMNNPLTVDDENGMGSAIGDFNNDGLLDWFVSAVYDSDGVTEGNWGASGNRLYQNLGNNQFQDVARAAGVENGSWGWGSSFADLNNDGFLDIVQTNGWPKGSDQFYADTTRIFLSNQNGTFEEVAINCGLQDTGQGRGLSILDYDLDGDLDIFINNYRDKPAFWRNDLDDNTNFISVKLNAKNGITAVGSKVLLYTQDGQQVRELRCGTNYNGQNPLRLHFGLGSSTVIDSLIINWPNGESQKQYQVASNQFLEVNQQVSTIPSSIETMHVFPNPFVDVLEVQFQSDSDQSYKLRLFDINGQLISEYSTYSLIENSFYFEWDLENEITKLPTGTYLLQLCGDNQVKACKKIVKN